MSIATAFVLSALPASAAVVSEPASPERSSVAQLGETRVLMSADGLQKLEFTLARAETVNVKGAALLSTISFRTASYEANMSKWCGPLSPTGYCLMWSYTLHTDFQYDGTYLYSDFEYQSSVAYSGYSMRDHIQNHYTTQTDPANGWAMTNRSWGRVTIDRWASDAVVDSCTIQVNTDIHGTGASESWWDIVSSGWCN